MLHARKSYNERVQDSANIIPEDEPVFLLRGQDQFAPMLLDMYIAMTRTLEDYDVDIVYAVTEHVERMREWQRKRKVKVADMEPSDRFVS